MNGVRATCFQCFWTSFYPSAASPLQVWGRLDFSNSCTPFSWSNFTPTGTGRAVSFNSRIGRSVLQCKTQRWSRATSCQESFSGYTGVSQQRDSGAASCYGKCIILFIHWWKTGDHYNSTQGSFRGLPVLCSVTYAKRVSGSQCHFKHQIQDKQPPMPRSILQILLKVYEIRVLLRLSNSTLPRNLCFESSSTIYRWNVLSVNMKLRIFDLQNLLPLSASMNFFLWLPLIYLTHVANCVAWRQYLAHAQTLARASLSVRVRLILSYSMLWGEPIRASAHEVARNPRAKVALLHVFQPQMVDLMVLCDDGFCIDLTVRLKPF